VKTLSRKGNTQSVSCEAFLILKHFHTQTKLCTAELMTAHVRLNQQAPGSADCSSSETFQLFANTMQPRIAFHNKNAACQ
jgi:hypothetical protein